MTSIAIQQLLPLDARLRSEGEDLQALLNRAGIPIEVHCAPTHRLSWGQYVQAVDAILASRDEQWLCQCGADSIYAEQAADFRRGLLIGFDRPADALSWLCAPFGPFKAVTPNIETTLHEHPDGRACIRSSMTLDEQPYRPHHHFTRGVLMEFPRVLFERRAEVEIVHTDTGADFLIRFPARRWLAPLRRNLQRMRPQPEYLDSVGHVYNEMNERQSALQQEREALKRTEETLRSTIAASGEGVFEWEIGAPTLNVSDRMLEIFGLDKTSNVVSADDLFSRVHDVDRHRMQQELDALRGDVSDCTIHFRWNDNSGQIRRARVRAKKHLGSIGTADRIIGTFADITELDQARLELLTTEKVARIGHFRASYRRDGDTISVQRLHWSPELFSIFGLDPKTFTPTLEMMEKLFQGDDGSRLQREIGVVASSGQPRQTEVRLLHPDGSLRIAQFFIMPDPMNPSSVFGTLQDVTEHRSQEEQLRRARTFEMIGQIAGGVAHDFNNLLGIILGNLELLQHSPLDAKQSIHVQQSLDAVDRASALTQRLLSYSRKQFLHADVTTTREVLENIKELMKRVLPASLDFKIFDHAAGQQIEVDVQMLESCLINLIVNARDAMSEQQGECRLLVCAEMISMPGHVTFFVEDNGPGIAPELISRIREPFFSTKPSGQGSGMGLAMVQGFADQNGGQLNIVSDPHRATRISLTLPCAVQTGDSNNAPAVRGSPKTTAENPDRSIRVLLVDDHAALRESTAALMTRLGCQVVSSPDARSALMTFRDRPDDFELLLTDMVMGGGMNGLQLIESCQAIRHDLKCMLMTGYTEESYLAQAAQRNVRVLQKPFGIKELETAITQAVDRN